MFTARTRLLLLPLLELLANVAFQIAVDDIAVLLLYAADVIVSAVVENPRCITIVMTVVLLLKYVDMAMSTAGAMVGRKTLSTQLQPLLVLHLSSLRFVLPLPEM